MATGDGRRSRASGFAKAMWRVATTLTLCLLGAGAPGGCQQLPEDGAPESTAPGVIDVLGLEFVPIEPGSVAIPENGRAMRRRLANRRHFHICRTEITNAAYRRFDPTHKPDVDSPTPSHPAISISWHDARAFCRWLGALTGMECRLPTETEWEYAARAGSRTAYCFGSDVSRLGQFAWYRKSSGFECHEVGRPSEAPDAMPLRVLKGGSWRVEASACRLSAKMGYLPDASYGDVGFRPVLIPTRK